MATLYICDRCSSKHTIQNDITKLSIEWQKDHYDGTRFIKADLCESCMMNLEEFIKPLPKEGK